MDSNPPADASAPDPSDRTGRIQAAAREIVRRRCSGEALTDEQVAQIHPDLMPGLLEALHIKERIRQQALLARRAGTLPQPVIPLTPEELASPLGEAELAPAPPAGGIRIHGYRIVREISAGGQAAVFEAVQETTRQRVAVKVMAGGPLLSSENRARFEREVRALAALEHPHIVGIIDRGQTEERSAYLVMEYIDGAALDEHLRLMAGAGARQAEVVVLFAKIARALHEAHRQGIVHRDIKPSNIRIDRHGEPHILDFGLAHRMASEESERCTTRTGNVIGSLPWASPEQANGETALLGPPTDVYSLGIVLYEALTGEPPYPRVGTTQALIANILHTVPVWPRKRSLPFGAVSPALRSIVGKALAKEIRTRYPDAGSLADDLEACLKGARVGAQPPSRRRLDLMAGALLTLAAAGFLAWKTSTKQEQPASPYILPTPLVNSVGIRLMRLPPGSLSMGSSYNTPGHEDNEVERPILFRKGFYISVTEVTRGQYKAVMKRLPDGVPDEELDCPVNWVSWDDAVRFCDELSRLEGRRYHLPTEPQWEYACRAGRSFESRAEQLSTDAWYAENSGGRIHPVGRRRPNTWGLYDMLGNVSEWCQDGYVPFPSNAPQTDPEPRRAVGLSALRGGGFESPAADCRPARRMSAHAQTQQVGIGFRVVLDLEPTTLPAR